MALGGWAGRGEGADAQGGGAALEGGTARPAGPQATAPAPLQGHGTAPSTTPSPCRWKRRLSKHQKPRCRCPWAPRGPDPWGHLPASPLCSEGMPGWPSLGHLSPSLEWRRPAAPCLDQFWGALPMHALPGPRLSQQVTLSLGLRPAVWGQHFPGSPSPGVEHLPCREGGADSPGEGAGRLPRAPSERSPSRSSQPAVGQDGAQRTFSVRPALQVPIRWPEQSAGVIGWALGWPAPPGRGQVSFDLPSSSLSAIQVSAVLVSLAF